MSSEIGNWDKLTRAITQAAITVLSQMDGSTWTAVEANTSPEPNTTVGLQFEGDPAIEFSLSVPYFDALQVLSLFLGSTVEPSSEKMLDGEQVEIIHEFVRQVMGLAVSQLRPEFGELKPSIIQPTHQADSANTELCKITNGNSSLHLQIAIDPDNTEKLRTISNHLKPTTSSAPTTRSSTDEAESSTPRPPASQPLVAKYLQERNFDFLMDVELQVSLRFGRREMLLKDILELSSGSVVELDRTIQEPVDLLLGHKVIARGEVVIVEGNYGLRITEVAPPRQRIESLC